MPKFNTTIEIEVEVEYTVAPGQKGYRNSMGVPEEPDIEPSVEDIMSVSVYGKDILYSLDRDTLEQINDEAFHHLQKLEKEFE